MGLLGLVEELGLVEAVEVFGEELDVALGHEGELVAHLADQNVVAVGVLGVLELIVQAVVAEGVHARQHPRRDVRLVARRAQQLRRVLRHHSGFPRGWFRRGWYRR